MGVPAREGAVVPAVPLARARTVAYAVVALAGLGVYAGAGGGLTGALGAVIVGAAWTALLIWMRNQAAAPPPLPVAEQDLPPAAAVWRVLARDTVLYAAFVAAGVGLAHGLRSDYLAGLLLGTPVMCWVGQRSAERTEHELNGTLWRPAGFTVRPDPVRYWTPTGPASR